MTSTKASQKNEAEKLFVEAEHHEQNGDLKRAFCSYLAAAKLGDSNCQVNTGNYYSSGQGVRRDMKEAARWYKLAYKNGERCGAHNLAIDYRNIGNARAAVIWFKKAIAIGDGEACYELAKIYLARKGGRKAAIDLLRQALLLSRKDISESGREDVESLLKEIAIQNVRATLSG